MTNINLADETATAAHKVPRSLFEGVDWSPWNAKGIVIARGGEVYLVQTLTPMLVGDARQWARVLYSELKQNGSIRGVEMNGLTASEKRKRVSALRAWINDPDDNTERIEWLYPLLLRQVLLTDTLTLVTPIDLDRFVDAILAHPVASIRLHPFDHIETDLATMDDRQKKIELHVAHAKDALAKVQKEHPQFDNLEWVLCDGQLHPPITEVSKNPLDWLLYGEKPRPHPHRAIPTLYATRRLSREIECRGINLAPITIDGGNDEIIKQAVRDIVDGALMRNNLG